MEPETSISSIMSAGASGWSQAVIVTVSLALNPDCVAVNLSTYWPAAGNPLTVGLRAFAEGKKVSVTPAGLSTVQATVAGIAHPERISAAPLSLAVPSSNTDCGKPASTIGVC